MAESGFLRGVIAAMRSCRGGVIGVTHRDSGLGCRSVSYLPKVEGLGSKASFFFTCPSRRSKR